MSSSSPLLDKLQRSRCSSCEVKFQAGAASSPPRPAARRTECWIRSRELELEKDWSLERLSLNGPLPWHAHRAQASMQLDALSNKTNMSKPTGKETKAKARRSKSSRVTGTYLMQTMSASTRRSTHTAFKPPTESGLERNPQLARADRPQYMTSIHIHIGKGSENRMHLMANTFREVGLRTEGDEVRNRLACRDPVNSSVQKTSECSCYWQRFENRSSHSGLSNTSVAFFHAHTDETRCVYHFRDLGICW